MTDIIYHNGNFTQTSQAVININDRGLRYGDGVFDTMLAVSGVPQFAPAHFERLVRHAAAMGISVPIDFDRFQSIVSEILQGNDLSSGHAAVNTSITRGNSERGLSAPQDMAPNFMVRAAALPPLTAPIHAVISQTVRRNEGSPLSRIKSLNYGDMVLARMEAEKNGANESILLNNAGHVTCTTIGNIFAVLDDGTLVTPPLSDGVMDGIIRARVIAEYSAQEVSFTAETLRAAKEIYITNSLRGAVALHSLDGKTIFQSSVLSAKMHFEN